MAARGGHGNTALALSLAAHNALGDKAKGVLYFSTGLDKHRLMERLIGMEAKVSTREIRAGIFSKARWSALTSAGARFIDAPLFLADTPDLSAAVVHALSSRLSRELRAKGQELSLIVIDSVSGPDASEIMSRARRSSVALNAAVVVVVRLASQRRKHDSDSPPDLAELRDKGLVQHADGLVLLHLPEPDHRTSLGAVQADISAACRPKDTPIRLKLRFDRELAVFSDAPARRGAAGFKVDLTNPNKDVFCVHSRRQLSSSGKTRRYHEVALGNPPIINKILNEVRGVESLAAERYCLHVHIGKAFKRREVWKDLRDVLRQNPHLFPPMAAD